MISKKKLLERIKWLEKEVKKMQSFKYNYERSLIMANQYGIKPYIIKEVGYPLVETCIFYLQKIDQVKNGRIVVYASSKTTQLITIIIGDKNETITA